MIRKIFIEMLPVSWNYPSIWKYSEELDQDPALVEQKTGSNIDSVIEYILHSARHVVSI